MRNHLQHIQQKLDERKANNALRELKVNNNLVDFCSNDYLGFAKEAEIHQVDLQQSYGSTGSRLISGNNRITEETEAHLAAFYDAESALVFNSGYNANLGFFSCVPERGDTILYDELIHASIRDGIRLSHANSYSFKHNDLGSLRTKLEKAKGKSYLVVESIYSMDGDEAPLAEMAKLCEEFGIALVVDEAHAVGVFGEGRGLVAELNLEEKVFARIITFGKAYGAHGAAILGDKRLKDYLINFARPLIYTTALPLNNIIAIRKAHDFLLDNTGRIQLLNERIAKFTKEFSGQLILSRSAIQCMVISGNNAVKAKAKQIQALGLDVRPILSPTVEKGKERLRICLHSFNSEDEINQLVKALKE